MTSPVGGPAMQQRISTAIAEASARTGVSFDYLMDQARIESGMRPDARAATSSATGLYQFTRQSWLGTVKTHGAAHGLDWAAAAIERDASGRYSVADPAMREAVLDLRTQPEAAAAMAAEFAADNHDYLTTRLAQAVAPVDLYLAHFLGAAGAARFLEAHRADPDQAAAPLFPAAASANRAVFYRDGGAPRSLRELRERFAAKLGNQPSPMPPKVRSSERVARSQQRESRPLEPAPMLPMPGKLDLEFARNAYRRLAGDAA
jgi:hypothetical protein